MDLGKRLRKSMILLCEAWENKKPRISDFADETIGVRQLADSDLKNIYFISDNGQYPSIDTLKIHDNFRYLSITDKSCPSPLFIIIFFMYV